jgi:hypothetical protein
MCICSCKKYTTFSFTYTFNEAQKKARCDSHCCNRLDLILVLLVSVLVLLLSASKAETAKSKSESTASRFSTKTETSLVTSKALASFDSLPPEMLDRRVIVNLGDKNRVNIRQNTTASDDMVFEQLVQLLVVADRQLNVARYNANPTQNEASNNDPDRI